jgi:hypothetical protein
VEVLRGVLQTTHHTQQTKEKEKKQKTKNK